MRSLMLVLPFVVLTFLCWGIYGPVLHEGQYSFGGGKPSSLRPLICVGISYFVIAVVVPLFFLFTKGEKGKWTTSGFMWSFAAGAAGAIGALGITLAFKFRGNPVYVMPLVFGCAPVVNTLCTMTMARSWGGVSKIFIVGVVTVAIGAAGVMYFKPTKPHEKSHSATESVDGQVVEKTETPVVAPRRGPEGFTGWMWVIASIATTALCWGCYGPVLHKGQMKMSGSRLRPLLCVGLAYFAVAVVVPVALLYGDVFADPLSTEPGDFFAGSVWSLAAGAAGAIGALGVILAFNFGGKPIFVMPLVFGCAPVVNTAATVLKERTYGDLGPWFLGSLALVIAGAATVLIFAPKPTPPAKPESPASDETLKDDRPDDKTEVAESSAADDDDDAEPSAADSEEDEATKSS